MAYYRNRKDHERVGVLEKYQIVGFISSGTYGRVFKAKSRRVNDGREFAIKKFKPDKEGEAVQYSGISQSACREMALCKELTHENVIRLVEIILEEKCIYMVFEYAEHDLLSIIHFHSHIERKPIPEITVRSLLWQLLNGVSYLHQNWVIHRDLKPANIMVTSTGQVKAGDLGLARIFYRPIQPLFNGDKVVVTIWYRAPELLMGARHYSPAIDMWAFGCIFAELLALRPIFKGEEVKMDNKKTVPFQKNQMQKIVDVLGTPKIDEWPDLTHYPESIHLVQLKTQQNRLEAWYRATGAISAQGLDLLRRLLIFDPLKRITASEAMLHPFFGEGSPISQNAFQDQNIDYPSRKVTSDDRDIGRTGSARPIPDSVKRSLPLGVSVATTKRLKSGN